ncbi:hypothetical protein BDR04DRAFT_1159048 [Suillus decipiens]|nr:hypothetical protein BDR04DRAFT_1159048 [Suillus decipiens]
MESHPFFPKIKGFGMVQVSQPINAIAPQLAKVMLVLAINSPLAEVEEDSEDESTTTIKKCKLAKCISKAVITDTEDEDGLLARPTISVKPSKDIVPVTPVPSNSKASTLVKSLLMYLLTTSQNVTKEVKKGKGKEKAVEVKEPELYGLPCTKCSNEHKCIVAYDIRGLPVKACSRCFILKVKYEQPADNIAPTNHIRASHPRSKAMLVSKSKPASRMTRATSHACPPMPVVEFKDAIDDADVAVAAHKDVKMSHGADAKQPTHIAAMTPTEPEVNQPAAIASADDFPTNHWQKDFNTIVMPPPSPPLIYCLHHLI